MFTNFESSGKWAAGGDFFSQHPRPPRKNLFKLVSASDRGRRESELFPGDRKEGMRKAAERPKQRDRGYT